MELNQEQKNFIRRTKAAEKKRKPRKRSAKAEARWDKKTADPIGINAKGDKLVTTP